MGITGRFAMPLLSTLAALVIIVHSAEENLDREIRDLRFDLRPRLLDTRPPENDQPWRVVRADPMMQHTKQSDVWNNESQEETPRRRLGRKRKRRPPVTSAEDEQPKIITSADEDNDHIKVQEIETGRRRKKIRPNRMIEDGDRPMRRRGQKRKRPSLDNWPELSEFGTHHRDNRPHEKFQETKIDIDDEEVGETRYNYSRKVFEDDYEEKEVRPKIRRPVSRDYEEKEISRPVSNPRYVITQENDHQEHSGRDKSLSEFSMEVMNPYEPSNTDEEYDSTEDKLREKSPIVFKDMDKAQENEPIDPVTLKDILKRSNGTSLSEILQQHNLTLADLLNGKENALAVLKSMNVLEKAKKTSSSDDIHTSNNDRVEETDSNENVNTKATEDPLYNATSEYTTFTNLNSEDVNNYDNNTTIEQTTLGMDVTSSPEQTDLKTNIQIPTNNNKQNISSDVVKKIRDQKLAPLENRNSGMMVKRRFPASIRRKLRMRPMVNNTFKSQINRDLIALSARRYIHHNRRNMTKSKEWREMIPLMVSANNTENHEEPKENTLPTTTSVPEDTTTIDDLDETIETTTVNEISPQYNATQDEREVLSTEVTEPTTITIEILATEMDVSVTEKPILSRPMSNVPGLRRQAFNNRLKKKRMKQRTSTTEAPQDDIMKNLLEMGNLVSSSEFIARTQLPKATSPSDSTDTGTELEDFLTTETTNKVIYTKSTRYPSTKESAHSGAATQAPPVLSTEETAKFEIEEILNDTRTSAKLSKILKERNMTLNELFEHRERGSSHVHLADIFHNASREPNPPEPFLSKSLLEPISKETYPLRAILEANSYEQVAKATTVDPIYTNHVNIPVIMDFGNNVNENAENMGIMSLFNNFTTETMLPDTEKSMIQQDSKGISYKSTITAVNATDDGDTTRESRMLGDDQDMISWNEIFSMIRKNQKNETNTLDKLTNELPPDTYNKVVLEEDADGDGLLVFKDLQRLRDTETKEALESEEKVEFNSYEGNEAPLEPGILSKEPSSAKSVTVATASIVGLAMILFLLTYAALKWKQQRAMSHKKNFGDERIPTPVFENRKVKKNCSSRSISPMLPTSNIYTMNTLESQNGKDSPEYMWDTLRKPFQ